MRNALQKLCKARTEEEKAEAEAAQLDDEEPLDDEAIERTKEAWLTAGSRIEVLLQEGCNLHAPKPGVWPVECRVYDETATELQALERFADFGKLMRAASKSLRTLKLRRELEDKDYTDYYGASVIGGVAGFNDDGTLRGVIWFQKRVRYLDELNWNYGSSTEARSGLDNTLGAPNCVVCPVALVEGVNADLAEGTVFEAAIIATGLRYIFQCPPPGVPPTNLKIWAPAPLKMVLANPKHDLYPFAVQRIAPPLTPPLTSEERGELTKEGLKSMSAASRKRQDDARQKRGIGLPGKDNYASKNGAEQLARYGGYPFFLLIIEARECIQLNRKPAPWAADILKPTVLKRVAKNGLAKDEFWTVLPKEEELGVQGFDIEEFIVAKPEGLAGKSPHASDYKIETQRGPFPSYDVAVALGLVREGKRAPKLPGSVSRPNAAPAAIKELIARAVAWSPPQPSPPPTKKPRSAPLRRSARLKK